MPRTRKVVPEVEPEQVKEEPAAEVPAELVQDRTISDLEEAVKDILGKNTFHQYPPTLVSIPTGEVGSYRFITLNIHGEALQRAWDLYKERTGSRNADAFLIMVLRLLGLDTPRVFSTVYAVDLS